MQIILIVLLPLVFVLLVAVHFSRLLKRRLLAVPSILKGLLAAVAPATSLVAFFWIWDEIHYAFLVASGGVPENVQMVGGALNFLVMGFPIYLGVAVIGGILAVKEYKDT